MRADRPGVFSTALLLAESSSGVIGTEYDGALDYAMDNIVTLIVSSSEESVLLKRIQSIRDESILLRAKLTETKELIRRLELRLGTSHNADADREIAVSVAAD